MTPKSLDLAHLAPMPIVGPLISLQEASSSSVIEIVIVAVVLVGFFFGLLYTFHGEQQLQP